MPKCHPEPYSVARERAQGPQHSLAAGGLDRTLTWKSPHSGGLGSVQG